VALFEAAFDKACREKHLPPGYRLEVERMKLPRHRAARHCYRAMDPGIVRTEVDLAMESPVASP